MKRKLSITIEEDIIEKVERFVRDRTFRNKSHCIEFALGKLLDENERSKTKV